MKNKETEINELVKRIEDDLNETISANLLNAPNNKDVLAKQIKGYLAEWSSEHIVPLMEKALNPISKLWSGAELSEEDISCLEGYGPMAFTHLYGVEIERVKYCGGGKIEYTLKEKVETIEVSGVVDIEWELKLPKEIKGSGEEEVPFIFERRE